MKRILALLALCLPAAASSESPWEPIKDRDYVIDGLRKYVGTSR